MRLLIDMDGVCAKTIEHWLQLYNVKYFDNLVNADIKRWNVHEFVKPACGMAVYHLMEKEGFFAELDPMEGVAEAFDELTALGHDLIIVTAAPRGGRTALYDKVRWAKKHLPNFDTKNMIATHRKDAVIGDLLLDDGGHNIEAFPGRTCVFDQPWNQGVESTFRVKTWAEFVETVKLLELDLELSV